MALLKEVPNTQEPIVVESVVEPTVVGQVTSTEVATVSNHAAPAVAMGNCLSEAANQGFEGLAFDWTSFPTIKLENDGKFTDIDGHQYGKEFTCYLRASKPRYVYLGQPVKDNKRDVAYSYDRVVTASGQTVEAVTNEWKALGKEVECKEYLEVLVEIHAPGEANDGEFRLMQVSPASKGRFSGHYAKCAALGKGDAGNVITKVKVGEKITKTANSYFPWAFEVVRAA